AIGPVTRGRLAPEQLVADGRIPFGPGLSALDPHGLGCIILAVEIMIIPPADPEPVVELPEIGDAVADLPGVVLPRALQRHHPRRRPGELAEGAAGEHVAEAAVRVLRLLHVADARLHRPP